MTPQSQQFLRRISETSGVGKATGLPPGGAPVSNFVRNAFSHRGNLRQRYGHIYLLL